LPRPLPELVLFLDHCLGTSIVASALRAEGIRVEVLSDHFPQYTPDEKWLPIVGERGWIVLTKDQRIRHREVERQALLRGGVGAFVLTAGEISGSQIASAFVAAYPRMRRICRDVPRPFVATISVRGEVRVLPPARRSR